MPRTLPALSSLVFLAALLAAPVAARAVSIYDVIQLSRKGYSGREIVGILEATNSAFDLSADDVVRLKQLGVEEVVVQKMLALTPPEPAEESPAAEAPGGAPPDEPGDATGDATGIGVRRLPYHNRAYEQTDPHTVVRKPEAAVPPSASPEETR
jgi:hypothetical protein